MRRRCDSCDSVRALSRVALALLVALLFGPSAGGQSAVGQTPPAGTPEVRGTWVARKADERDTGRDMRATMRMRMYDRQDRVRERMLTMLALRGGAGRSVPADRTLVRFTYPNDIKGTAFLVWEQPDGDDERFLFLPSLGRVRRIASGEAQESFVGSDFTYEDIGGREFDDYAYRLIEGAGATDTWTGPDGVRHPVFTLESRSKAAGARFPRIVSLVTRSTFIVVHAEIRNRRDEVQKTFEAQRVAQVGKYWTVLAMRMVDTLQRTRTDLTLDSVEYDVGLGADDFSRRELERGASAAGAAPRP